MQAATAGWEVWVAAMVAMVAREAREAERVVSVVMAAEVVVKEVVRVRVAARAVMVG